MENAPTQVRVIKSLARKTFKFQSNIKQVFVEPERNAVIADINCAKAGVILPKSFHQWKLSNDYVIAALPIFEITTCNPPSIRINMNNVIYNYFKQEFRVVNSAKSADLDNRYNGYSTTPLRHVNKVISINVSMGALGVMGFSSDAFLTLLQDENCHTASQKRIIMKTVHITILSKYYIFYQRSQAWSNPELLNF